VSVTQQQKSINVDVVSDLPPLVWLVALDPSGTVVLCGADVEIFADGCFEGCWAGEFGAGGFDSARHVFGSGFRIRDGRALFVTPSHTLDALYALWHGGRYTVSNSLAFLAQFSGLELPYDFDIGRRFTSIRDGIDAYERVVLQGRDWKLYRFVYQNFEIRDGGDVVNVVPKGPEEPAFGDYASYKGFLLDTLGAVLRNGASPARRHRYEVITTCSSGYDSTACTALAAALGCRQALSLRTARGGINREDSGRAVTEALGLELTELERPGRARGTAFEEAEFFATGMGGEDYVFLGFAPHCRRRIVLTGFHGDVAWDRLAKPADTIVRKDVSGSTLTEVRLRHGFVQVPVPFIGATRHTALHRITESAEMEPYRVGGRYDRPIPRRIAEEQGARRGTFATAKKAGSIVFGWTSLVWSPTTLRDLERFERRVLAEQGVGPSYHARWAGQTSFDLTTLLVGWSANRVRLKPLVRPFLNRYGGLFRYNHPRYDNMAFLWAVDKVRARYPAEAAWRSGRAAAAPAPPAAA
jgi:hypothetical protein